MGKFARLIMLTGMIYAANDWQAFQLVYDN